MAIKRKVGLCFPLLLAACTDPMTATDGILSVAGRAQTHNAGVHVINSNPVYGAANPGGSGQRVALIIQSYNTGKNSGKDE